MPVFYAEKVEARYDPSAKVKYFHAKKVTRVANNFSGDILVYEAELPSDDEQIRSIDSEVEGVSEDGAID